MIVIRSSDGKLRLLYEQQDDMKKVVQKFMTKEEFEIKWDCKFVKL